MVKRGMVATMQKLEAQSWVAKDEWKQLYGTDSKHYRHLETRWKTLYMVLKACGYDPNHDLRNQLTHQDIKGRGLVSDGSYIVA
tara:strand:+ start:581 stop:832 length:252 start_codon:yes stop_codon:yes gene_type:complete